MSDRDRATETSQVSRRVTICNKRGLHARAAARFVKLADSFDAMTSKRTYRDAMTVDKAMEQIREGLGTQFDEKVGRVFLESDVHHLWEIMQGGPALSGNFEKNAFAEYGVAAVGTLIK